MVKVSQNIASQNSVKFVKNPQKNHEKIFHIQITQYFSALFVE